MLLLDNMAVNMNGKNQCITPWWIIACTKLVFLILLHQTVFEKFRLFFIQLIFMSEVGKCPKHSGSESSCFPDPLILKSCRVRTKLAIATLNYSIRHDICCWGLDVKLYSPRFVKHSETRFKYKSSPWPDDVLGAFIFLSAVLMMIFIPLINRPTEMGTFIAIPLSILGHCVVNGPVNIFAVNINWTTAK